MAEEGTQHMDDNLYNAALRWRSNIPADVTDQHFLYRTPGDCNNALHVAAQHGNPKFIEAALDRVGPEHHYRLLCQQNSKGETPLHLAAEFGHMAAVKVLLLAHDHLGDAAVKKSCWSEKDTKGDTPLHKALRNRHKDIAMALLVSDIQLVSVCNEAGESPAYLAAEGSCKRVLERILDADHDSQCSVSFSGPFGQTVFHSARRCTGDIMNRLIEMRGALLKEKDGKGKTVIHYAVEENRVATVETLLTADSSLGYLQDNDGLTPLLVASSKGLFQMVSTILKLSPQSVEIRDNQGKTVLHVAKIGDGFLSGCLKNKTIKELLNQADNDGNTPLHTLLLNCQYEAAYHLLGVDGCNWRLKNNEGHSPLDLCKSDHKISHTDPVYSALRDLEGGQRQVITKKYQGVDSAFDRMEEKEVEQVLNKMAAAAGLFMTLSFQMTFNVTATFRIFTISNTITFMAATATLMLCTLAIGKRIGMRKVAKLCFFLTVIALQYFLITYTESLSSMGQIYQGIAAFLFFLQGIIFNVVLVYWGRTGRL